MRNAFKIDARGYTLRYHRPGEWRIISPSGATFAVDPHEGRCTWPDFVARGHRRACKHMRALWAIFRLIPDLETWEQKTIHRTRLSVPRVEETRHGRDVKAHILKSGAMGVCAWA